MQQILAYETDLLEFEDLFDGSPVVAAKVEALKAAARTELAEIDGLGGSIEAVESGWMKRRLVDSNTARIQAIEAGEQVVVGVNRYTSFEESPLSAGEDAIMVVDPAVEQEAIERLDAWRAARDANAVEKALADLKAAARSGANIMPPSIAAAKAGVTTGEWAQALRDIYGNYRAPTGVSSDPRLSNSPEIGAVREAVDRLSQRLGARLKVVVGKPGLDGHSNGAEQIAVRARDCGMDVAYEGIRLTPEEIVQSAKAGAHILGLSILSGSHLPLVEDVLSRLKAEGLDRVPVIVGGIIPPEDEARLKAMGVAAVYTPKNFDMTAIMADLVRVAEKAHLVPA